MNMFPRYATTRILIFIAIWLVGGNAEPSGNAYPVNEAIDRLRFDLDRIFSDSRFAGAQWGVQIYSLDREETLYERDAAQLLIPASNTKIITAAVSLLQLEPDYRFRTLISANGVIENGTLDGDLIVTGFGDPSITVHSPNEDPFETFRSWARILKEKGIRKISGNILGDGSAFGHSILGKGWEWNDLTEGYAAPVSALQFNGNRQWLEIHPTKSNSPHPSIRILPLPLYWIVENELSVKAEADDFNIEIERNEIDESMTLRGIVPANSRVIRKEVAVSNPTHWYLSALKHALEMEQIDTRSCSIQSIKELPSKPLTQLIEHQSEPLSEILKPMLKESLNLYAETLIRVLGLELKSRGSFENGKEIIEETLDSMAISANRYAYADGSGLSRLNLVSSAVLVRILRAMHRNPYFTYFYDALAIAGQDGTLENRLKGSGIENHLHAKTGSLSGVSAITGYLKTGENEMLAFSMIANNFLVPKSEVETAQDRALKVLYRLKISP